MHFFPLNSKRRGCLGGVLVVLLLVAAISCPAQADRKLPDSITPSENDMALPKADSLTAPMGDSATIAVSAADSARQDNVTRAADIAVLRAVPDSTLNLYQRGEDFAYANDSAYWKVIPPDPSGGSTFLLFLAKLFGSSVLRIFVYILLGSVLLFALYKIVSENNLHLFYRSARKVGTAAEGGEGMNLLEEDLDAKITEALQAKNHRLSTRYLFLKALRLLDERELIRYQAEATNHEYILQMSPRQQAKDFRFLAGAYEHVWYGDFPLNDQQFEWLLHYFQDFYKSLPPGP